MNNRGIALKNIHSYLVEFTSHINQLNASGFYDFNKEAENISVNLLNAVYGYNLVNANNILSANFPAIDLVDDKRGIVIQVTSDSSNKKLIHTIQKFKDNSLYKKYDKLYIYILTKKPKYYNSTKLNIKAIIDGITDKKIIFDVNKNIIDNTLLGESISGFTDLQQILDVEKLLQLEFGSKPTKLLKPVKNEQLKFKFDYRNRLTDFLGREEEVKALNDFFHSNSLFSWWIITGKAGSGKSRLALEFGNSLQQQGAEWGFLLSNQIDSFDWAVNYPRPIVIVIDYAQSESKKILNFLNNLTVKRNYQYKIRVLLIERVAKGQWWNELINDYYVSNSLFNATPLEVTGLSDDELYELVNNVASIEGSSIKIDKKDIIENISRIDLFKRPLFAMFAGVALAKGQYITNWDQYNLLDFLIEDDLQLTLDTFKEYNEELVNKHRNLLAVTTVCYGLSRYNIEAIFDKNIKWLPTPEEFDNELYNFISFGSTLDYRYKWTDQFITYPDKSKTQIELSPLLPDVFGEYFVLKTLDPDDRFKYKYTYKNKEFINLVESTDFYFYCIFLRRLLQDFPTHRNVIQFLVGSGNGFVSVKGTAGSNVIEAMEHLYIKNFEYLKCLWNYTKILAETDKDSNGQMSFYDDPDRIYQEASLIMVSQQINKIDEQEKYYAVIKANTDKLETNPKEFVDSSISPYEDFDIEKSRKYLSDGFTKEQAEEYISKKIVRDERIPQLETLAIGYILSTLHNNGNISEANTYIDRLFYLSKTYSYPKIKIDTVAICVQYGTNLIKDFDKRVDELFFYILKTPNQPAPVNVQLEQYKFTDKLVKYMISIRDSSNGIRYYRAFKNHLFSLKPNPNIGEALVALAFTAQDVAKQFYEKNILITGDIFLEEIIQINLRINTPPLPKSPLIGIINKLIAYRQGNFS